MVPTLARALATFRSRSGMDMAFGGTVNPSTTTLQITDLCGARTTSLSRLVVPRGAGLGGKSLQFRRPIAVSRYAEAEGITHVYDSAVNAESLETVVAFPVFVDSAARAVVYVGNRSQVELGDRWFDSLQPLLRRFARDIAVEDEVRRRLALLAEAPREAEAPSLTRADLRDIVRELEELAGSIGDDSLRIRVERLRSRLALNSQEGLAHRRSNIQLAPREVDVLERLALGDSNKDAADYLGLMPNTVKSYLKVAMRKLHARNRVQAISAARAAGLIP